MTIKTNEAQPREAGREGPHQDYQKCFGINMGALEEMAQIMRKSHQAERPGRTTQG